MKLNLKILYLALLALMVMIPGQLLAQPHGGGHGGYHGGGGYWADSLEFVEASGIAIVQPMHMHDMYYLDVDGDQNPDYFLNFGPYWYEPDNGNTRPEDGDSISVAGFLQPNHSPDAIIVTELNGEFWRDQDGGFNGGGHHGGGGYMDCPDFLPPIDASGTVSVDTSFCQPLYFLDVNDDQEFDYILNFGPYWYQPEGIERPQDGDQINVSGYLRDIPNDDFDAIWVEYLNGELWRECNGDSSRNGQHIRQHRGGQGPMKISTYPNPFNPQTRLMFTTDTAAEVSVQIYNLSGQLVDKMNLGTLNAGDHSIVWNAANSGVSSGVYFAVVSAGDVSGSVRMFLLK